jgi:hypothetical protein
LTFDMLLELCNNFLSALWELSKSIQGHRNQMTCSIDSSKIKRKQLLCYLLFADSFILMWFALSLSLLYLAIDLFHLCNVLLNEILFSCRLFESFFDYFIQNHIDFIYQALQFLILFCKVHFSDILFEE